ncbi:Chitinase domain-containing protein 1 [Hordeum vulgare]|nr:Chitinase domain-containing protein 1 [Hordeum vulgare]
MEVSSNFSGMEDMHKESDIVVKKATPEELKALIPDIPKGAMSVDLLRWAMNLADFGDARPRDKWTKYTEFTRPRDPCATTVFMTRTVVTLEEEQKAMAMSGRRSGGDGWKGRWSKDIKVYQSTWTPTRKRNSSATRGQEQGKGTRRSNHLQGRRG